MKIIPQNHPHTEDFSRQAPFYDKYNIIQKKAAKKLMEKIKNKPKKILDIGCGSGEIYKNIEWEIELFIGVDLSSNMCKLHPKNEKIKVICENFENEKLYENLTQFAPFDIVISSSALQWAKNPDKIFKKLASLSERWAISLFCDKTFKTIRELAKIPSSLPSKKDIVKIASKYKKCSFESVEYRLFFKDNLSKFRYIKKSGVSGGEKKLSFKEIKNLIENYPLPYLEFEVIYIIS